MPEEMARISHAKKEIALMGLPRTQRGRPQTPLKALAEILALDRRGLNEDLIAKRLGLTKETVRKRLRVAKKRLK